ncbi:MAG: EAL domain-containing protein, partial [Lachnospiraceae bacterium]|nr:EAL domain-containing protein [Lachnospiraceae bacterium]
IYAENGKQALALIRDNKRKLSMVMLDLLMPEMDGFSVMEIMRQDDDLKNIPVIVLTSEKDAELKSLELGAADFITKPYDMPEIILARAKRIIELSEDKLIIMATERDDLTKLYTRKFFFEYAAQLDQYYPEWDMDAVVFDIDHFHLVNELYGRSFGDTVLKKISEVLMDVLLSADGYACRYESDKFFMYCTHIDDYETIYYQMRQAVDDLSESSRVHIRMGIYPNVDKELNLEQRFDRARLTCNSIRNNYAQSIAYYDMKVHEGDLFAERLIHDFPEALERGDLKVFYQPKYGITAEQPVLASAEALVRWQHPEMGLIAPGRFIPMFEQNGLIQKVDHFVWNEVARQIRKWNGKYGIKFPVSVNVSRIDIYDPHLESTLLGILAENGLQPQDLMLEVTESAYASDTDQLIDVVQSLREKGFRIEMDDFGSGYSSLNMLTMLPIDVLKLDMQFIKKMHKDEKSQRLVQLVMDIAEFLSVPVVAEGAEEEAQYQLLKNMGCSLIQGYYFSKPLPVEEFEKLLETIRE